MSHPDLDATTPKKLGGKYAVVGVGETSYVVGTAGGRASVAGEFLSPVITK